MSANELMYKTDISLAMECFDDELSPVQMLAYKEANETFSETSKTLKTLVENNSVIYENSLLSLVYLFNKQSSSQCLNILPDSEINIHNASDKDMITTNEFNNSYITCHLQNAVNSTITGRLSIENSDSFNYVISSLNSANKISKNVQIKPSKWNEVSPNKLCQLEVKPLSLMFNVPKKIQEAENLYLSSMVMKVLSYEPAKFTEWLLKQGLLCTGQFCRKHRGSGKSRLKMRQYLCSGEIKFYHSGGYAWVSDCCPSTYLSVFKGTIFEGASYGITVPIKLLYHWSCQTNVSSVQPLVTVTTGYLKSFYKNLRGVCIAANHEDCETLLGGKNYMVEVGFISLVIGVGEGAKLVHKTIWILGVLDVNSKRIRMQVIKSDNSCASPKPCKHQTLLLPLMKILDKNSTILTDLILPRNLFTTIGFKNVYQRPIIDKIKGKTYSNKTIMTYLRNCLPRALANAFPKFNRPLIQQCLDELCWREKWGGTSLRAFSTIIDHISKQTKLYTGVTFASRLSTIARFPFLNWKYWNWRKNFYNLHKRNVQSDYSEHDQLLFSTIIKTDITPNKPNLNKNKIQLKKKNQNCSLNTRQHLNTKKLSETPKVDGLNKLVYSNYKPIQKGFVPLETYYYGTTRVNMYNMASARTDLLNIQCVLCDITMQTNICVMTHIMEHVFDHEDTKWCKYCLRKGSKIKDSEKPLNFDLFSGLSCSGAHWRETMPGARCLICEENFKFRTKLILHMHFTHNELELPYECGVCKLRSSQHYVIVDHFYEMHKHSIYGQCPLCLKVVTFKDNEGNIITQNISFFLNHMKKHNNSSVTVKCNRCVLSFVTRGSLVYHKKTDHASCKDLSNVRRRTPSKNIMMPQPVTNSPLSTIENFDVKNKCTVKSFSMKIDVVHPYNDARCFECKKLMIAENHFVSEFSCWSCQFKTCCGTSMVEHASNYHTPRFKHNPDKTKSKRPTLIDTMYCLCGYKTKSGNRLTEHLVYCGKKSAYKELIDENE